MRKLAFVALLVGCASNDAASVDQPGAHTFAFGPYTIAPMQEISDQCVQITLHNDDYIYVNSVELTTGLGFHHSNWLFVPEFVFPGPHGIDNTAADDGTYKCSDRGFDQAVGGIKGGVLFAQSTQTPHEIQAFPPGVIVEIPPHSKLVSTIHLLNPGDTALSLKPTIALTTIAKSAVTTTLHGMSFENHALGLPPNMQSKFTVECDLLPQDQTPAAAWPQPDFHIYYALAHYHTMGTGMQIEAIKPDGTTTNIFDTAAKVGDTLGGALDPPFSFAGYAKLRFSCDYYNPTSTTVPWGIGSNEMCVFLAFTDSQYIYAGGVVTDEPPGDGTNVNGVMTYTHACQVYAVDGTR